MEKIFKISWDFGNDPEWFDKERLQDLLNENYGEQYKVTEPTEYCSCLEKKPYFMDGEGVYCSKCKRIIIRLENKPKPKIEKLDLTLLDDTFMNSRKINEIIGRLNELYR